MERAPERGASRRRARMPVSRRSLSQRFHDLEPHRIREILLVASPYDAFILEQDGQLTEQVFQQFWGLSLSGPPRVNQVSTGRKALEHLERRRFDLILVMSSLADMEVNELGRRVKEMRPGKPVVFLALDPRELEKASGSLDRDLIDGSFLWTGDAQIFLAVVKFIEDRENADHDIAQANLRVILVLEDSPHYYSSFLVMLYKELTKQAHSLYQEGVNDLQRRMYMRSRPKILHAASYEAGLDLFERYRDNLMAIISDVRIPKEGNLDAEAGLDFLRFARGELPDLPALVLSAEAENADRAAALGLGFADKTSDSLLGEIENFLRLSLGFGDFVFRNPEDLAELGRARDVREFERLLETMPAESVAHHGAHDHFSAWLLARSEFYLAETLRPKKITDFQSIEEMRDFVLDRLHKARETAERGVVTDFRRESLGRDLFSRIGAGSLGSKARGIAFLHHQLAALPANAFGRLPVKVPKTVAVSTEAFEEMVETDDLWRRALELDSDRDVAALFLSEPLPRGLQADLRALVEHLREPLAVRSSSRLEDSMHQPFAGIYATLMLPNIDPDVDVRLRQLAAAVRLVYASTFFREARAYRQTTSIRSEREKMAVIVQALVGRKHGPRFYPDFSGTAHSYNFYPIGVQRPEDGVVNLALGLGRMVVEGGQALRLSPRHPGVVPQLATQRSALRSTQRRFFALDLASPVVGWDLFSTVRSYDLAVAEEDGTLAAAGSVLSTEDDRLRDSLDRKGPRIVTFNNLLRNRPIGLLPALGNLLEVARDGLGCEVEMEFAGRLASDIAGTRIGPGAGPDAGVGPELFALQVRPVAARTALSAPSRLRFRRRALLCATRQCLGHGVEGDLHDIVYVRRETWNASKNQAIAREVGELNEALKAEGRPYILIGPGRWGTSDEWLGIPVKWGQISGVRVIVEASPQGYDVEPSQGTHFFQNITSLQIGYLTLPPGAEKQQGGDEYLDWQWLDGQAATTETEHLRHLRFPRALTVVLDGRQGRGAIARPGAVGTQ